MVKEIRIYVEGGGSGEIRSQVRRGFSGFLKELRRLAQEKRIRWFLVACGSRNSTYDDFMMALRSHPDAFNVLLVDAEGPVNTDPCQHLHSRDGWDMKDVADEQCHLMVQLMESWFLADMAMLKGYYGQGFNENPIPGRANVEEIPKDEVLSALEKATSRAEKKGRYHKTHHAPDLLEKLTASQVRSKAPHCERLFQTLIERIHS